MLWLIWPAILIIVVAKRYHATKNKEVNLPYIPVEELDKDV